MTEGQDPQLSHTHAEEIVKALYRGFFGREADHSGLQHWLERITAGDSAADVLAAFVCSSEYRARNTHRERNQATASRLGKVIESLQSANPLTVVDVGAQRLPSEPHIYSSLLTYAQTRVIGFEPLEHRLRERERAEADNDLSMRAAFIGDGQPHTFHINEPDSNSSLLPLNREVVDDLAGFEDQRTVSSEQVSTVTLDEAIADVNRIDFLKLDIQGFEYNALAHAPHVLSRTLVVQCEVEFLQMYRGQSLFSDIDQLLTRAGFRFIDFASLCRYRHKVKHLDEPPDQLLWGDAIYFRERSTLADPTHLLVQALIALAVYEKSSLAAFLTQEHANKTGA